MAFKEYDQKPTFLDMEIQRGFENSRNRQILSEIDETTHWEPLEKMVAEHYPVGQ
jgi:hypothetical protein